nr:hypothetical protein [Tanacetum cinerariifolium]
MTLTFTDTHNMVSYLNKFDASEGFNQIIDFLNGSYIEYALTVNLTIYVSCTKQFWNTVAIKHSKDVTRLQALVDRNKVVVTEAAIREALRLDDADGVDCLPKEQGTDDNAAEEPDTAALEDNEALDGCAALTRRVEHLEHDKVAQDIEIIKLKTRVKKLERANKVKALKLRRLRKVGTSQRVNTSDDTIMEYVSNQGRMIDELDRDEGAVLMSEKEENKAEEVKDITGDAQVEGRHADIYQVDIDHAAKVLSIETVSAVAVVLAATVTAAPVKVVVPSTRQRRGVVIKDPEEESSIKTPTETKSKDKGKGIMVEEPKPMKKKQQVKLDEAYARKLHEELNQDIDWEVAIDHV